MATAVKHVMSCWQNDQGLCPFPLVVPSFWFAETSLSKRLRSQLSAVDWALDQIDLLIHELFLLTGNSYF
jgi:hypothetical protein